mmetsp:Transcript_10230/g.20510  ORF Transcript_10230/g.20510 Transcript_10230/m.20510 type:complete len:99 (+) Transcript_10230:1228-1524(+)
MIGRSNDIVEEGRATELWDTEKTQFGLQVLEGIAERSTSDAVPVSRRKRCKLRAHLCTYTCIMRLIDDNPVPMHSPDGVEGSKRRALTGAFSVSRLSL